MILTRRFIDHCICFLAAAALMSSSISPAKAFLSASSRNEVSRILLVSELAIAASLRCRPAPP